MGTTARALESVRIVPASAIPLTGTYDHALAYGHIAYRWRRSYQFSTHESSPGFSSDW
jgi:hypothetical protein